MSIYTRDYMREEPRRGPSLRSLRGQSVTIQLIVINVVVFVLWQIAMRSTGFERFMGDNFTVSATGVLREYRIHTLVTSAISQAEPYHGLFNMLFLYWFGSEVESLYGRRDYALLYVIAGAAASLAHVALQSILGQPSIPALGASGAIMGIVVVFACFFPNRRVYFLAIVPITVKWLAIVYVAMDVLGVLNPRRDPVAHAAHLGGAVTGYLFYKFWRPPRWRS